MLLRPDLRSFHTSLLLRWHIQGQARSDRKVQTTRRHTPDADVHHGLNVLFNELLCTYKFALLVILASYLSFTREFIVSRVVDICDYGLLFIVRESLYIDVLKINVDMVSFACNYCAELINI